ncbi:hypothetical protein ACFQV4_28225, partial [Streptomyces thermocarboxydus]
MAEQHHADPTPRESRELLDHPPLGQSVLPRRRLVSDHNLRPEQQRLRQHHPLLLAPDNWCGYRRNTASASANCASSSARTTSSAPQRFHSAHAAPAAVRCPSV